MQRIADIKGLPVIGRKYLVPCVFGRWTESTPESWYPVLGPPHDDAELIGVHGRHWHFDARFLDDLSIYRLSGLYANKKEEAATTLISIMSEASVSRGPKLKVLMCMRQMPCFPMSVPADGGRRRENPFAVKLEAAYRDVKLKPGCLTCPHRGVPLNALPVTDGVVVCPGHGLAWNLTTGKMVPRVREFPKARQPEPAGA